MPRLRAMPTGPEPSRLTSPTPPLASCCGAASTVLDEGVPSNRRDDAADAGIAEAPDGSALALTPPAAGERSDLPSPAASLATLAILLRERGTPGPSAGDAAAALPPAGRGGVARSDRERLVGETVRLGACRPDAASTPGEASRGRPAVPSGPTKPAMLPPPSMLVSNASSWNDTRRPASRLETACGAPAGDASARATGDDSAGDVVVIATGPMSCIGRETIACEQYTN